MPSAAPRPPAGSASPAGDAAGGSELGSGAGSSASASVTSALKLPPRARGLSSSSAGTAVGAPAASCAARGGAAGEGAELAARGQAEEESLELPRRRGSVSEGLQCAQQVAAASRTSSGAGPLNHLPARGLRPGSPRAAGADSPGCRGSSLLLPVARGGAGGARLGPTAVSAGSARRWHGPEPDLPAANNGVVLNQPERIQGEAAGWAGRQRLAGCRRRGPEPGTDPE